MDKITHTIDRSCDREGCNTVRTYYPEQVDAVRNMFGSWITVEFIPEVGHPVTKHFCSHFCLQAFVNEIKADFYDKLGFRRQTDV